VEYLFTGHNISEIDRVSENLSSLRFKDNPQVSAYTNGTNKNYDAIEIESLRETGNVGSINLITTINEYNDLAMYSGAKTARNDLFNKYYRYEIKNESGNIVANRDLTNTNDVIYRIKNKTVGDKGIGEADYYGKYLGTTYYTGKIGNFAYH
jgi:hypothetical protein